MLIELFMLYQVIALVVFCFAYYNNQVVLWGISMVFSGMLMLSSYGITKTVYLWNVTTAIYDPTTITYSYPALFGINLAILAMSLLYFFSDLFQYNILGVYKK